MLQITKQDMVNLDGSKGLQVWWLVPPKKKNKVMCLGWSDLVIIKPSLKWPAGFHPGRHDDWGKYPLRIDYLKQMERISMSRIPQVADLSAVLELKPDKTRSVIPDHGNTKVFNKVLFTPLKDEETGEKFYVAQMSLRRLAKACDTVIKNLYLRLYDTGEQMVVIAFHRGVRGVVAVIGKE